MKRKVQQIAKNLSDLIYPWRGVEAVLLGEAADIEVFDPYFTIDLDVYVREAPPIEEERRRTFKEAGAFEPSRVALADRFLMADLPVTVHYIGTSDIGRILQRVSERTWVFHEPGTNVFYRLVEGSVLKSRGDWISTVRGQCAAIPEEFWNQVGMRAFVAAERALADLGAAVWREDPLFTMAASARLARSIVGFLFAANRRFEPSGRMLYDRVKALPALPEDGFLGRFETFLRQDGGLAPQGRREVAELLVKSLLSMI